MDHYSILDQSSSRAVPEADRPKREPRESSLPIPSASPEALRFPGDDGGKSLVEMAERDLNATLQLLAERAQYITGASGAAIALREGGNMICRARAGPSAPELGAHLQVNSGLSDESIRTQQILRCDDAETDARVNRESCRALGIVSIMVMPLLREREVSGVFELLSSRAHAFEERDLTALERLGGMIQTAMEHAQAAKRAQIEIAGKEGGAHPGETAVEPESTMVEEKPEDGSPPAAVLLSERGNIRKCEKCGFPVSEGRMLCLDCEASQTPDAKLVLTPDSAEAPIFLSPFINANVKEQSWLRSRQYLIGTLLVAAITAALLLWLRWN
jgi:putative methionine-R-sulfoxide reductase with GAF domain